MLKTSVDVLKKIEKQGFEAYIVGGFVRDYYMNNTSVDVDICTNATPYELSKIFKEALMPSTSYGSVTLIYLKVRYEITTFRKELRYKNRKPIEIEYINDLESDLKRRDFTINTLCMNSDGEIIDLLNGRNDIKQKTIKMIGDPNLKLKEDALRILRAIRFATILNFKLDGSLKKAINKNRKLLKTLSYTRKKEELTRILTSSNAIYGVSLLRELKLDRYLDVTGLSKIKIIDDILGIWAQLDVIDKYPFNKTEREMIFKLNEVLKLKRIDNYTVYKYGLYIAAIAASIKGIEKKMIIALNDNLPIKGRSDIAIDINEVCQLLNKKPDKWLKKMFDHIEKKIVTKEIPNDKKIITNYIINNTKYIL